MKNIQKSLNNRLEGYSEDMYMDGLKNTLSTLKKIKRPLSIYYILENPELGFNPKNIIPRPFISAMSSSTVSRTLYDLRMKSYNASIKSSMAGTGPVLDPRVALCNTETCKFFNGSLLYADDDHLSVAGSKYVFKFFEPRVFQETND